MSSNIWGILQIICEKYQLFNRSSVENQEIKKSFASKHLEIY